jgi:polar amino acid transport system substrate-binding protein
MFARRSKWIAVVGILVVISMLVVVGCNQQTADESTSGENKTEAASNDAGEKKGAFPTIKEIKDRGKLVVGTGSGYFPFEMVDKEGKVIGFDMQLAQKIADELKVDLEIKDMDFTALIPALQADSVDMVIAGMTIIPERALSINFIRPYFKTGQGMIVNKEHKNITDWKQMDKEGMVIALSMGTTGDMLARDIFENATLKQFEGSSNAGLEVVSGRADAMVYDVPWCAIYTRMNKDNVYPIHLKEPISTENFGIAIKPGEEDLLQWMDTFLWSWVDTYDYNQMYDYWFVDMPWWDKVEHKTK